MTDVREDMGRRVAAEIGGDCHFMLHDVTSPSDWKRVVLETEAMHGKVAEALSKIRPVLLVKNSPWTDSRKYYLDFVRGLLVPN